MKLAVSNIAWVPDELPAALDLMEAYGACGLEIAPGIAFAGEDDPFVPSEAAVSALNDALAWRGIRLVSMQSLLFGVEGAMLFGDAEGEAAFRRGMMRAITLAGRLGIANLVMGSPRNRRFPEDMAAEQVEAHARAVFSDLGKAARANGTVIAMETNPAVYGTNLFTTTLETARFVAALDHPGVTLNLDLGSLALNDEFGDLDEVLDIAGTHVSHVHVSEPHLAPAPSDPDKLATVARALADRNYERWISIEMRRADADPLRTVEHSLSAAASALRRAGA